MNYSILIKKQIEQKLGRKGIFQLDVFEELQVPLEITYNIASFEEIWRFSLVT